MLEFTLQYVPQKAIKGQVQAKFLVDNPILDMPMEFYEVKMWRVWFDGSRAASGSGAGIVLESPHGIKIRLSFLLNFPCMNNQAEYKALIISLDILVELEVYDINIFGDSIFIVK